MRGSEHPFLPFQTASAAVWNIGKNLNDLQQTGSSATRLDREIEIEMDECCSILGWIQF